MRSLRKAQEYFEPVWQLAAPQLWMGTHRARVTSLHEEGDGMYTLQLKPRSAAKFEFTPGQHVELLIEINGKRCARYFSISSSPHLLKSKGLLELSIKRQRYGEVTNWVADNVQKGMTVHLNRPSGDFSLNQSYRSKPQLILAAGSGITPFMSMLRSVNPADLSNFKLLYWVKNAEQMPFKQALTELEMQGLNIAVFSSLTDGRIRKEQLEQCLDHQDVSAVYACGPGSFIPDAKQLITELATSNQHPVPEFYSEQFGIYVPSSKHDASVDWSTPDGKHTQTTIHTGTLLEAAEQAGLTPLFGCRAGICRQCTAKKQRGRVKNLLTGAISNDGPEEIQLCICVPDTDLALEVRQRSAS